ncbi:Ff.00g124840.m01.CDS01 [Fusarium sp. VM40]|nr:Ff.00g124840.m01.CDS01 [Fusarium sp. VM40]
MESFLGLDLTRNYSFFTVPAAFLVISLPHAYTITVGAKGTFDRCSPRSHKSNIENCSHLDKANKQFLLRAKAATENGFETLGLYASGLAAANFAGVPTPTVNALGFGYLASRVAYNVAYLWLQMDPRLARVRSLVWVTSIAFIVSLWVKAGNKMLSL